MASSNANLDHLNRAVVLQNIGNIDGDYQNKLNEILSESIWIVEPALSTEELIRFNDNEIQGLDHNAKQLDQSQVFEDFLYSKYIHVCYKSSNTNE